MAHSKPVCKVAVLSDTHGLLRPEVLSACMGTHHILHAGDVGSEAILAQLAALAPVTAIRGNIDTRGPCASLSATEMLKLAGVPLYMLHALPDLDINLHAAGVQVVVSGHSHTPSHEWRDGILYLNPGSAGPRRFRLPVAMAYLLIDNGKVIVEPLLLHA